MTTENPNLKKLMNFTLSNEHFADSLNLLIKNSKLKVTLNKESKEIELFGPYNVRKLNDKDLQTYHSDLLKTYADLINKTYPEEDKNTKVQVFEEPITKEQIKEFIIEEFRNKQFRTEDVWNVINKKWTPQQHKRNKVNISNMLCKFAKENDGIKYVRTLAVKGNVSVYEII